MALGTVLIVGDPIGFETLSPTTATGITSTLEETSNGVQAQTALVTVETQPVRFRMDGTAPTAAVGHVIAAGGSYVLEGHLAIKNFQCIDTAAGASTVRVTTFA